MRVMREKLTRAELLHRRMQRERSARAVLAGILLGTFACLCWEVLELRGRVADLERFVLQLELVPVPDTMTVPDVRERGPAHDAGDAQAWLRI